MGFKKYLIENNVRFEYVDGEDNEFEDYDGIDNVAKKSGINILRGKDANMVAIVDDQVVGVLFTEFDGQEYSFDVAVLPEFQNMGIGKRLTDMGISEYHQYEDMGDITMRLDVVNPKMVKLLQSKGLVVTDQQGGHVMMEYPKHH